MSHSSSRHETNEVVLHKMQNTRLIKASRCYDFSWTETISKQFSVKDVAIPISLTTNWIVYPHLNLSYNKKFHFFLKQGDYILSWFVNHYKKREKKNDYLDLLETCWDSWLSRLAWLVQVALTSSRKLVNHPLSFTPKCTDRQQVTRASLITTKRIQH